MMRRSNLKTRMTTTWKRQRDWISWRNASPKGEQLSECVPSDVVQLLLFRTKLDEPTGYDDHCICAFDRNTHDAWPCFLKDSWESTECDTCNEHAFCTKDNKTCASTTVVSDTVIFWKAWNSSHWSQVTMYMCPVTLLRRLQRKDATDRDLDLPEGRPAHGRSEFSRGYGISGAVFACLQLLKMHSRLSSYYMCRQRKARLSVHTCVRAKLLATRELYSICPVLANQPSSMHVKMLTAGRAFQERNGIDRRIDSDRYYRF